MNSLTIIGPCDFVSNEPVVNIYNALAKNTYLRNFKLSGYSKVEDHGIAAWISNVIQNNHSLIKLDLSEVNLKDYDISCILLALKSNNTLKNLELREEEVAVTLPASAINAIADNRSLTHLKIGSSIFKLGKYKVVDIEGFLHRNKWLKIYSDYLLLLAILHKNGTYFPSELFQIILSLSFGSELPVFFADQFNNSFENLKKPNTYLKAKPLAQRLTPIKDFIINNETDLDACINYLRITQLKGLRLSINNSVCIENRLGDLRFSLLGLREDSEVLDLKISNNAPDFRSTFDAIFVTSFIKRLVSLKSLRCTGLAAEGVLNVLLKVVDHPSLEELCLEIPTFLPQTKDALIELVKNSKLTSLSLSFFRLDEIDFLDNFFPDIFQAVSNNIHLRHFEFSDFRFVDTLVPICRLITHNQRLESLDLINLGLSDIQNIITCLVANTKLRSLDLRGNDNFPFQLSPSTIKALKANHKLTYLGINYYCEEEIKRLLRINSILYEEINSILYDEETIVEDLKVAELSSEEESSKELSSEEKTKALQSSEEIKELNPKLAISEPDQAYPLLLQICKAIAIFTITASFVGLIVASTVLSGGLAAGVLLGCSAAFLLGSFGLFEVEQREKAIDPVLYSETCLNY